MPIWRQLHKTRSSGVVDERKHDESAASLRRELAAFTHELLPFRDLWRAKHNSLLSKTREFRKANDITMLRHRLRDSAIKYAGRASWHFAPSSFVLRHGKSYIGTKIENSYVTADSHTKRRLCLITMPDEQKARSVRISPALWWEPRILGFISVDNIRDLDEAKVQRVHLAFIRIKSHSLVHFIPNLCYMYSY